MATEVKRIAILGSTGSIGRQTLEVVRAFPHRFQVVGLAAGRNVHLLNQQVREFAPTLVSLQIPSTPEQLPQGKYQLLTAQEMAAHPDVDLVVVATPGSAGLAPTLAAIRAGKQVALANKEVLVMAGNVVSSEASQRGKELLPLDSEHSAVWQCLRGEPGDVARIILTASGGPFYSLPLEQLPKVTARDALQHPIWQMGQKVTIDSATLMNKGMEVLEAQWLFHIPVERIEVIIHRESVVHSMVEFVDGSIKAQLGFPDMRLPIQYALSYPERLANSSLPRLDLNRQMNLSFEPPDSAKFPCLGLAYEAARKGGTYPAALCGADEVAVALFQEQRIGFMDIPRLIQDTLERHQSCQDPSLEEILAADAWAKDYVHGLARK